MYMRAIICGAHNARTTEKKVLETAQSQYVVH